MDAPPIVIEEFTTHAAHDEIVEAVCRLRASRHVLTSIVIRRHARYAIGSDRIGTRITGTSR